MDHVMTSGESGYSFCLLSLRCLTWLLALQTQHPLPSYRAVAFHTHLNTDGKTQTHTVLKTRT